MKAWELLSDESKWCKDYLAVDADGHAVGINDPTVCRFCMYGAIAKCYPVTDSRYGISGKIDKHLGKSLVTFNDSPTTTFADVQKVLKDLDI